MAQESKGNMKVARTPSWLVIWNVQFFSLTSIVIAPIIIAVPILAGTCV